MLYGSDTWCLIESEMGILRWEERSMVRATCIVQIKDRKKSKHLMLVLGLNETIHQLVIANSNGIYG